MIGKTLDGRYEVIRSPDQGRMGAVPEAMRAEADERVAVELINTSP